jgi:nucleotide-binding universal stress UspA family protein
MRTVRLDSMVVGLDFSAPSIRGAKWASETFAPAASMTLVHVIDPPDRPRFASHVLPTPEAIEALAREDAETRMHDVATFLTASASRCEVRVGKPHEQIAALVREIGADLVVIGPHGDRPRTSRFLGTTADRIVRTSPVPVLVATTPSAARPRRLLALVDDADVTPTLLAWTHDLAETFDADVTLLHVWSNATYSHVASMSFATTANEAEARAEISKDLHDASMQWLNSLARTGVDRNRITSTVTYGNPGDVALETAKAVHADLILMGRSGSGLVAPALLGSTVGTVLHGARCPVLVVTEPRSR